MATQQDKVIHAIVTTIWAVGSYVGFSSIRKGFRERMGVEISDMPDSYLEQALELEEPPTIEQSVAIMKEAYGKMRTMAKLKSIIDGVDDDDFNRVLRIVSKTKAKRKVAKAK